MPCSAFGCYLVCARHRYNNLGRGGGFAKHCFAPDESERHAGREVGSQLQRGSLILWQIRQQDAQRNATDTRLGNGLTKLRDITKKPTA